MGIIDRIKSAWSSKGAAEVARHQAAAAYYRMARQTAEAMASYRGGVQTRVDTPWCDPDLISVGGYPSYGESYRQMRNRARLLEMNNPLASSVLDRDVENVIGSQIRLRPTSSSPEFNKQARAYIREITSGTRMDVRHRLSWGAMQRAIFRSMERDGDVGVIMVNGPNDQPQLQIVEAHLIESPPSTAGAGRTIIDGVELNEVGRAVAYWVKVLRNGIEQHERIDARDFIFLFRSNRTNGVRGEPVFHGTYTLFDQIYGYLDATVQAARVGACQAMLALRKRPDNDYDALPEDVEDANCKPARSMTIEPGQIHFLDAESGEDLKGFTPTQPAQNFPDAIRTFARFLGLKFGLTVEQVLLDFSKANFSVSKAARNQANVTATLKQEDFHAEFLGRWYAWVISKGVKSGRITAPEPEDSWSHEWIPPYKPLIEPHREVPAMKQLYDLGIEALSNLAMELGYDFEELMKQRAEDRRIESENGEPAPTAPGSEPGNGSTTPTEPDDEDDEDGEEDEES